MKNKALKLLWMLVFLIIAYQAILWIADRPRPESPSLRTIHSGPTIEQIQALSVLTTTRVQVADVQVTELQGHTGGVKAVLVVKGDFTVGVDLSRARFESVDEKNKCAVLILPQPTVQSPRVDHDRTRLIGVYSQGLWKIVPGGDDADTAVLNAAMADAQRLVAGATTGTDIMQQARTRAEQVIRAFVEALGWRVEAKWSAAQ